VVVKRKAIRLQSGGCKVLAVTEPPHGEKVMTEKISPTRRRAGGPLGRLLTATTALVVFCTGLLVTAQPAHAGGCAVVSFANADRDLIVSVEKSRTGIHYGELRARATKVGPWELFDMCWLSSSQFTLWSHATGKYVSTRENNAAPYKYLLTATADKVGEWEKFTAYDVPEYFYGFTGSSGMYVSADYSFGSPETGVLIANRKAIGPWEVFLFHRES
jgi:hypothetical protein